MTEPEEIGGPVFVVGVGRSGTTLVQAMLASHPSFAFPPETSFLRRYVVHGTLANVARRGGHGAVVKRLKQDRLFQRCDIPAVALVEEASQFGKLTDANLYRAMLTLVARRAEKPRVGDKDPRLVEHLGLIARLFPEAWIVHVIRDPRDVLASKKHTAWSADRHVLRHLFAGRVQLAMGRGQGPEFFGSRYLEVHYEDLLARPEETLQDLCDNLGVEFDEAVLDHRPAARRLVSEDERGWKEMSLGPLLSSNTGKWKTALSAWEVAVTEMVFREAMASGAYVSGAVCRRLSVGHRILVVAVAGLVSVGADIYRLTRRCRDRLDGA